MVEIARATARRSGTGIIESQQPAAFVLENVKNLVGHDKGRTFQTIIDTLADDLGYDIHFKVLDAKPYVPQNRERIFIVGFIL